MIEKGTGEIHTRLIIVFENYFLFKKLKTYLTVIFCENYL